MSGNDAREILTEVGEQFLDPDELELDDELDEPEDAA